MAERRFTMAQRRALHARLRGGYDYDSDQLDDILTLLHDLRERCANTAYTICSDASKQAVLQVDLLAPEGRADGCQ